MNSDKTKIIVFCKRKGKKKSDFRYNGNILEVVDEFRYLGVVFNYKGTFKECQNDIKSKANRAIFALLSKGRKLNLPVDIMLELFDKTILPILLYGSEVWGYEKYQALDCVYLRYCKYLFGLKQSTPNCMIYGETGRYPVHIHITFRIINYWLKITRSHESKINKKLYDIARNKYENGINVTKWIEFVRNTLFKNGFGYVWVQQAENIDVNQFKAAFKERMFNQYVQVWKTTISESRKCLLYKELKVNFKLESYLYKVPFCLSRYLLKFRTCNHRLAIETGRYVNIERNERYCNNCNLNTIGDEFHLFYECQNEKITDLRRKFIPHDVIKNSSMFKFVNLLKELENVAVCTRICKFLKNTNLM